MTTVAPPNSKLPTLSAGSIGTVDACPRRLARHLDPSDRPFTPSNDGRFRLGRALQDAIRAAHELSDLTGSDIADHLDITAPPDLGREEAVRFASAMEHYAELAEHRPAQLHASAGQTVTRPSRDGTWALRAEMGIMLSTSGGGVEVRHLSTSPAPGTRPAGPPEGDLARLALLGPVTQGRPMVVTQLFTEGAAQVWIHDVTEDQLTSLRDRLTQRVNHARMHEQSVVPGWWCTTCPSIAGCPAVPATRFGALVS